MNIIPKNTKIYACKDENIVFEYTIIKRIYTFNYHVRDENNTYGRIRFYKDEYFFTPYEAKIGYYKNEMKKAVNNIETQKKILQNTIDKYEKLLQNPEWLKLNELYPEYII